MVATAMVAGQAGLSDLFLLISSTNFQTEILHTRREQDLLDLNKEENGMRLKQDGFETMTLPRQE